MPKTLSTLAAMLAIAALPAAAQAQVPNSCLTRSEAEAVVLVAMPSLIEAVGQTCAGTLPATSIVVRRDSALLAKYQAEVDRAWPTAREGVRKLVGQQASPVLDSQFGKALVPTFVVPAVTARLRTSDCGAIERFATLLQPLPPRNIAGLVASVIELDQAADPDGRRRGGLAICRTAGR